MTTVISTEFLQQQQTNDFHKVLHTFMRFIPGENTKQTSSFFVVVVDVFVSRCLTHYFVCCQLLQKKTHKWTDELKTEIKNSSPFILDFLHLTCGMQHKLVFCCCCFYIIY